MSYSHIINPNTFVEYPQILSFAGFILKIPFLDAPERDMLFDDQHSWNVAEQQFPDVLVESEGKHEKNSMTYM